MLRRKYHQEHVSKDDIGHDVTCAMVAVDSPKHSKETAETAIQKPHPPPQKRRRLKPSKKSRGVHKKTQLSASTKNFTKTLLDEEIGEPDEEGIAFKSAEDYLEIAKQAYDLEAAVLGGEDDILAALSNDKKVDSATSRTEIQAPPERKPAWEDDDDTAEDSKSIDVVADSRYRKLAKVGEMGISKKEHQQRLRKKFEAVVGSQPAWADLDLKDSSRRKLSDDEDEEERELSRRTGDYLNKSSQVLAPTYLQYKPVTHANKAALHKAPVSTVRFHPSSQVIMTAGKDQNLSFFQVDGKQNAKIQSLFIENFPIYCARYTMDGCHVIMGSRHRSFYEYDMISGQLSTVQPIKGIESQSMSYLELSPCGKYIAFRGDYGYVYILSTKSKELVCQLKMNGSVNCMTFSHDGEYLYTFGSDGEIYVWQMSSRQCIHRFRDEGCLNGTSIGIDQLQNFIGCGSEVGVVNIYNASDCMKTADPKPVKVVNNLLTQCTLSKFNSSGQLLALASRDIEKSVKLVNMSSFTVYQNYPSLVDKMANPTDLDFSPNSGYLAAGTSKGIVHMYRLQSFGSY